MSFHVRSLERRYAVPLMRYEHRAVRLTPPGQRLYQTARIMLAEEEHLVRVISGRHSGQVNLGASMAFEPRMHVHPRTPTRYPVASMGGSAANSGDSGSRGGTVR